MTNASVTMKAFYNVSKVSFKDINREKLLSIKQRAQEINKLYLFEGFKKEKADRYYAVILY